MGFIMGKKRRLEVETEGRIMAEPEGAAMARANRSGEGGDTVRISFRMARDLHRRLKLEGFVADHTPVV